MREARRSGRRGRRGRGPESRDALADRVAVGRVGVALEVALELLGEALAPDLRALLEQLVEIDAVVKR